MKKRYANPKNHKSIEEYNFKIKEFKNNDFDGYVSFIDIKKVKDEWHVPREDGRLDCILANDFKWVLFYPKENSVKYTINAFYNKENELVEWYLDMIKTSGVEENIPFILDLYLDLVITKYGEVYVLDENELDEALKENDITKEDYDLAYKTLNELLEKFGHGNNISDLKEMTDTALKDFLNN